MILLTGAGGLVGSAVLRRLERDSTAVRCLVRDPAKLARAASGVELVRGDLADSRSIEPALRDVDVVIHLAATIRDQRGGSIERISGLATAELAAAAARAGARRFIFFSTLNARADSPARFFRAKALAEAAVTATEIETVVFAPSIIYAPDDPFITLLRRLARMPVVTPICGAGDAAYEPIWAEDVADCVLAALNWDVSQGARFELAGPQTLSYQQIVELVLRAAGKRRRIVHIPPPLIYRSLALLEKIAGDRAFATADEAKLMAIPLLSDGGTRDALRLGVRPRPMAEVLGLTA